MLNLDPKNRPEAKQLLTHPWFYKKIENNHRVKGIELMASFEHDSTQYDRI